MGGAMWSELRTFFWLQWKLTLSMFRGRRTSDRLRLLSLLSRIAMFVLSFPMFIAIGIALALGLILLSARAAYEVSMMVNVFLLFLWLLLPASYTSQLVERFEMSRLFPHPVRFRSLVVGSTLMSMLTMTGLWTLPLLVAQVVGLTWHQPLAFPLIALGALPTFALLVLTGRIMDDFFDLVAGDRRLRAWVLGVLSLPFMLCWLGQYLLQYATDDWQRLPGFAQVPMLSGWERLGEARGPSEFLEMLQLSRLLTWLPPGWATAGMGLAVRGEWWRGLAFLALSVAFVGLLLWIHAGITRRLMEGAALHIGAERVRTGMRWWLRLPGPPALWALFQKDWLYLWRSPMPRRLLFSMALSGVALLLPLREASQSEIWRRAPEALPLFVGTAAVTLISLMVNMGMTANYFGCVDREGFATLSSCPEDRRCTLVSANLTVALFVAASSLALLVVIGGLTRFWAVLPLGLYLTLCMQVGGSPAYNLAAIIGPYRTQLKFRSGRQRGNMWGMLAWAVAALPVLALIVLPYIFWRPGLALTLPLGAAYSVGLYALTLKPLARLLERREHEIWQAVTAQE